MLTSTVCVKRARTWFSHGQRKPWGGQGRAQRDENRSHVPSVDSLDFSRGGRRTGATSRAFSSMMESMASSCPTSSVFEPPPSPLCDANSCMQQLCEVASVQSTRETQSTASEAGARGWQVRGATRSTATSTPPTHRFLRALFLARAPLSLPTSAAGSRTKGWALRMGAGTGCGEHGASGEEGQGSRGHRGGGWGQDHSHRALSFKLQRALLTQERYATSTSICES